MTIQPGGLNLGGNRPGTLQAIAESLQSEETKSQVAALRHIAESLERMIETGLKISDLTIASTVTLNEQKFTEDEFTPTAAQTIFSLSQSFLVGGISIVFVNGIGFAEGTDYSIAGNVLTWLDTDFTLATTDELIVKYTHAGSAQFQEDEFAAGALQTAFTLSRTFKVGGLSVLFVNGVGFAEGTDYTISGNTLTWLDTDFTLAVGDDIVIKYEFA